MSETKKKAINLGTQRLNVNGKRIFVLDKKVEILYDGIQLDLGEYRTGHFFPVDPETAKSDVQKSFYIEKKVKNDMVIYVEET